MITLSMKKLKTKCVQCIRTDNGFCSYINRQCTTNFLTGNRSNKWIKKKFKELREKRGNRCKRCDSPHNLQFAHIRETGLNGVGRGRKERYYDITKNPKSYILACERCHKLYDAGKISSLNPQAL